MKIAISVWNYCISTVFDFCDYILIINVEPGCVKNREIIRFADNTIVGKATRLRELGVQVLLCGAISRPLERMIIASDIKVIPFLRGTTDEILEAYLSGRLPDKRFVLPGCRPVRGLHRGRGHHGRRGGRGNIKKGW